MKLSLRWKLVVASVFIEVLMLGALIVHSWRLHQENLQQLGDVRLREVSVLLNAAIGPPLVQQDYAAINDVFWLSHRKEGISYFLLFDQDQHLIAYDGWDGPPPRSISQLRLTSDALRTDTSIPITVAGLYYGKLYFGINQSFLQNEQNELIRDSLLISAVAISASFFLTALAGRWLMRHLKVLENTANAVSNGNYQIKIAHTGEDEIGVVGRALNTMSDRLTQEIRALRYSEKQNRSTAKRLQAVFEAVPDYLTLSRLSDGMILYANRGFTRMTGYDKEYAIGKTSTQLGVWADTSERDKWVHELRMQGVLSDFETILTTRDRQQKAILLSATLVDIEGLPHIVAICKDVTERNEAARKIERGRRYLQAVLDAASEVAIIATTKEGTITMFNRGAEKMLGYRMDEVAGTTCLSAFHDPEELEQRCEQLWDRYGYPLSGIDTLVHITRETGSEIRNWTYIRKDGRRLSVSLAMTAMHDETDEICGYLGIARDVTPQLEAEAALERLNDELEHRVEERTAELSRANEELAAAMEQLRMAQDELIQSEKLKALGNIVAVVAHELNTPIGNSLTVATTLAERAQELEREAEEGRLKRSNLSSYLSAAREGTDILVRALNRSSELVSNFKHVAVDQTTDQRRDFDLAEVMQNVLTVLSPMLKKTPYTLRSEVREGTIMDSFPGPLEQVITNLVTNALVHAFEGRGQGSMMISAEQIDPAHVRLIFSDDGVGIETQHLSRIFDPFYTTKMGRGGTGLGLNIVHNIVTKTLGGHLEVQSSTGIGTRFIIDLPLSAPLA